MTTDARYAIYFAPSVDTPIWEFGSAVLGYDAASGQELTGFAPDGIEPEHWRQLTTRPRTYGFHATLKAPFYLARSNDAELQAAITAFAKTHTAFRLGPMAVKSLCDPGLSQGFVALTPTDPPHDLSVLERDIVIHFDRFREAISDADRQRQLSERLTDRQRHYLETYGYPFVLDEYRFHMTLTGMIDNAASVADSLADDMANRIGTVDLHVDALCLFRQRTRSEHFTIISRHLLGTKETLS